MLLRSAETAHTRAQMYSECSLLLSPPPFCSLPTLCLFPPIPILEHTSVLPRCSDEGKRILYPSGIDSATLQRFQVPPSNPQFYTHKYTPLAGLHYTPNPQLILLYKSMLFGAKARLYGHLIPSLVDPTGKIMRALSFWGLSASICPFPSPPVPSFLACLRSAFMSPTELVCIHWRGMRAFPDPLAYWS